MSSQNRNIKFCSFTNPDTRELNFDQALDLHSFKQTQQTQKQWNWFFIIKKLHKLNNDIHNAHNLVYKTWSKFKKFCIHLRSKSRTKHLPCTEQESNYLQQKQLWEHRSWRRHFYEASILNFGPFGSEERNESKTKVKKTLHSQKEANLHEQRKKERKRKCFEHNIIYIKEWMGWMKSS